MNIRAFLPKRSRTIVVAVAALVLIWLVVSRSVVAFLADSAPRAALWLDSRQPEALVNLADQAVNAAATPRVGAGRDQTSPQSDNTADGSRHVSDNATKDTKNIDRAFSEFEKVGRNQSMNRPVAPNNEAVVRAWATAALMSDPLNASALRILGQLAEADNDDAGAAQFMRAADRLSRHENVAAYWLLRNSAKAGNYKAAIHFADGLLRADPQSDRFVVPVLGQISEDKDGAALLKAVLVSDPPWRGQFISQLPYNVTDARTPLDLLLALRTNPVPPTPAEIGPYIDFLVGHNFYGLAYYTWLQFLPPADLRHAGLLFNGNFEGELSGLPFDWKITAGAGVTVDVVPRPDKSGEHALLVDFQYGRVDYHSVKELVMLAPGTYQFNGEYKGSLVGPRGMIWRVVCANGMVTNGGESPTIIGVTPNWQSVSFTFTVPAKDCPAQYVRLDLDARMASEHLISGSVLFDELQISHVASPSTSGG
jgi:tetratricopeptide (TPR) repeat protein